MPYNLLCGLAIDVVSVFEACKQLLLPMTQKCEGQLPKLHRTAEPNTSSEATRVSARHRADRHRAASTGRQLRLQDICCTCAACAAHVHNEAVTVRMDCQDCSSSMWLRVLCIELGKVAEVDLTDRQTDKKPAGVTLDFWCWSVTV